MTIRAATLGTTILAGTGYFAAVFAVGFLLGTIRVLFVVPLIGDSRAELVEMPLMLIAVFLAARWIVLRFNLPVGAAGRLPPGCIALALMLSGEWLVMTFLRNQTFAEYLASRNFLALSMYALSLLAFALMPWLVGQPDADHETVA